VPTKRESGSTKARMSWLVLGGPPARTTVRRPRPRLRAPPAGTGLAQLARTGRPEHGGVAARRGGRERAATWPPRAMGWLPSFASEQAPSGQQRSALALSGPVVLLALGIGWRAAQRPEADWAGLEIRRRLSRIIGPLWADRAEANIQVKSPRCLL
jgi:hypothetical protein